jgi:hypothetical protein
MKKRERERERERKRFGIYLKGLSLTPFSKKK